MMTITISNINNQQNLCKTNNNITAIDLDECKTVLINHYNTSNIYIKKIDVQKEGMKIPKIEYDFYANLNSTEISKINKALCKDTNIILYYPIIIDESENIDEFNIQSGYYNDICYETTSDEGSDILLYEIIKEFFEKNKTICQDDCQFKSYNYILKKAECECKVIESSLSSENININESKLYENIKNVKKIANLDILICTKELFSKGGLKKNI